MEASTNLTRNLININSLHTQTEVACGYCPKQLLFSGFDCEKMGLQEYKMLLDRGWRRCGTYYYKPHLNQSCCKFYAIRLNVIKWQQRNSQKKVQKKFEKFLNYEIDNQESSSEEDIEQQEFLSTDDSVNNRYYQMQKKEEIDSENKQFNDYIQKVEGILNSYIKQLFDIFINNLQDYYHELGNIQGFQLFNLEQSYAQSRIQVCKRTKKQITYTCQLIFKIYVFNRSCIDQTIKSNKFFSETAQYLQEKICKKLAKDDEFKHIEIFCREKGQITMTYNIQDVKSYNIERFQKITKTISLVSKATKSFALASKEKRNSFQNNQQQTLIPAKRKNMEIKKVRAQFEEDSYELYKRYSQQVHNKTKISKGSYTKFLCLQALEYQEVQGKKGKLLEYGCFHFKYYLEDELIFVSVVDLLPECYSLVYNFYEPKYRKLSLGVIGSLNDIHFIKEQNNYFPEFRYYYQGYYIQDNPKMKYKAEYQPSELLCPVTYEWIPLNEQVKQKIDQSNQNQCLTQDTKIIEDMDFSHVEVEQFVQNEMKLYIGGRFVQLTDIKQNFIVYFQNLLTKIIGLIGKTLAKNFIFGQPNLNEQQ